jgi:hypothetical protein
MEDEIQVNIEEFPNDGYERLHDEAMDQISVSIHSDCEEIFQKVNLGGETKMKISLSQEQLKLNSNKNFLTVPMNKKKTRSLSFSIANAECVKSPLKISQDLLRIEQTPSTSSRSQSVSEIIYAVPKKPQKVSSAPLHNDDDAILPLTASPEVKFKYPLMFYCKICNNILDDPRTLNCLHTFCCQCLARLDASNDLQNNQFWRKISDSSSCMYNERGVQYGLNF